MKQSEAEQNLRIFMLALQRYRDIGLETLGEDRDLAASLWPWVWGDKCPLPILAKILDGAETSGTLAPMDYYNMTIVLTRFMPEVLVAANLLRLQLDLPEITQAELPAPWDPEDEPPNGR